MSVSDILNWACTAPAWMEDAACTIDPELWFSLNPFEIDEAKKICRHCPVRKQCLTFAVDNDERFGVWGGETSYQRAARRNRSKRGNDAA